MPTLTKFIKRFFKSRGNLRWRLLYALEYDKEIFDRQFFACTKIDPGQWVKVTKHGNAHKR